LIVIHGVGNGKLKQEIASILKTVDDIEYYDASYKDYGYGATEVRIY
jgi:dsDNA-specific endonuclease/ATPase MutS2